MSGLINTVGDQNLAYVLLSLITEIKKDNLCIIAENEVQKEALEIIVKDFLDILSIYKDKLKKIKIPNILIVTVDEYYDKWEDYSGYRLVFLEDSNLKWSALSILSKYLKDTFKKYKSLEFVYQDLSNIIVLVDSLLSKADLDILSMDLENKDEKKKRENIEKNFFSYFLENLKNKAKVTLATKILLYIAEKMYE
ncbi:MAG: hypothetical protein Q6363_001680 [Candidatus Njordarchaeota archaeon]